MQTFIEQAKKNNVPLLKTGRCQFCGSEVSRGVFECMEIYAHKVLLFDYEISEINPTRFLIVDVHALQHSELHGVWNNHFHLVRLCLILEKKIQWNYQLSPKLSDFFRTYKKSNPNEVISPPPKLERGKMTAIDISLTKNIEQYESLVNCWAYEVYSAWSVYHGLVSKIADDFIESLRK